MPSALLDVLPPRQATDYQLFQVPPLSCYSPMQHSIMNIPCLSQTWDPHGSMDPSTLVSSSVRGRMCRMRPCNAASYIHSKLPGRKPEGFERTRINALEGLVNHGQFPVAHSKARFIDYETCSSSSVSHIHF